MKDDVELQVSYDTLLTDMCKQNYTQKCEHTSWSVLYFFLSVYVCLCLHVHAWVLLNTYLEPHKPNLLNCINAQLFYSLLFNFCNPILLFLMKMLTIFVTVCRGTICTVWPCVLISYVTDTTCNIKLGSSVLAVVTYEE